MTSSDHAARLCRAIHLSAVDSMPRFQGVSAIEKFMQILAAGYEGLQLDAAHGADLVAIARRSGLSISRSGRISVASEAEPLARRFAEEGAECATIHLGWGVEEDSAALELIDAVLEASQRCNLPLYPETHRATVLQDMARAVQLARQRPALCLNADFSHWYTGAEMVYGGFETKLEFLRPIFSRVRYVHGRIGDPGCMQVCLLPHDKRIFVQHFRQLWTATFHGFLSTADPGDRLWFTAELLGPGNYYARTLPNTEDAEICDRWTQSLLLLQIADDCFRKAAEDIATSGGYDGQHRQ